VRDDLVFYSLLLDSAAYDEKSKRLYAWFDHQYYNSTYIGPVLTGTIVNSSFLIYKVATLPSGKITKQNLPLPPHGSEWTLSAVPELDTVYVFDYESRDEETYYGLYMTTYNLKTLEVFMHE
jgi:hypothetical protein